MTRRDELVGFWDREAGTYDAKTAWLERRFLAESRAWVCARAAGRTLDVAVGTGANLEHYPAHVEVTGVDWSEEMIGLTRRRAAGLRRRVDLRHADATRLPFDSGSFDTVLCTFSLCSIDDEEGALREMLRVLRAGGELLLADHVLASAAPVRAGQRLLDRFTVPRYNEHFTRRPLATLTGLDVDIVQTQRRSFGAIERVHARARAGGVSSTRR